MTKWHSDYIQNAYRELKHGATRKLLDTLNIDATGKRVLDVGCGPGNLLVALSSDAPELLIGVDVDETFLVFGRSQIQNSIDPSSVVPTLLRASLPTLPFADQTFDLVTCLLVMPHVPDGEVLKVSGENVSVVAVEAVLAAHPAVLEAAVVGRPDPIRDEVPVGFVVARDPARPPSSAELLAWCGERLGKAAMPRDLTLLDELPRTSVGKIRKFLLAGRAAAGA